MRDDRIELFIDRAMAPVSGHTEEPELTAARKAANSHRAMAQRQDVGTLAKRRPR